MSSALAKCMHTGQYTHSGTHMDKKKKSGAERAEMEGKAGGGYVKRWREKRRVRDGRKVREIERYGEGKREGESEREGERK